MARVDKPPAVSQPDCIILSLFPGLIYMVLYCAPGLRIWRMLRLRNQLEESAIAESALVPPKEARVMLYSLLNSGFVSMQVGLVW